MTQALALGAQVMGRKMRCREAGWDPCCGGGRGGFHLALDAFEGLVGHWGRDGSRKLAMCLELRRCGWKGPG